MSGSRHLCRHRSEELYRHHRTFVNKTSQFFNVFNFCILLIPTALDLQESHGETITGTWYKGVSTPALYFAQHLQLYSTLAQIVSFIILHLMDGFKFKVKLENLLLI
jgi:hypothetical protein